MGFDKEKQIKFIIEIIKSVHNHQIHQSTKKIENIDLLNIDSLLSRIEEEVAVDEWENNYDKIVSIIEDILED